MVTAGDFVLPSGKCDARHVAAVAAGEVRGCGSVTAADVENLVVRFRGKKGSRRSDEISGRLVGRSVRRIAILIEGLVALIVMVEGLAPKHSVERIEGIVVVSDVVGADVVRDDDHAWGGDGGDC